MHHPISLSTYFNEERNCLFQLRILCYACTKLLLEFGTK